MILAHLGFLLTTLATFANAQLTSSDAPIVLDAIHNATSITGTWSSGSRAVITGPVSLQRPPPHFVEDSSSCCRALRIPLTKPSLTRGILVFPSHCEFVLLAASLCCP